MIRGFTFSPNKDDYRAQFVISGAWPYGSGEHRSYVNSSVLIYLPVPAVKDDSTYLFVCW